MDVISFLRGGGATLWKLRFVTAPFSLRFASFDGGSVRQGALPTLCSVSASFLFRCVAFDHIIAETNHKTAPFPLRFYSVVFRFATQSPRPIMKLLRFCSVGNPLCFVSSDET